MKRDALETSRRAGFPAYFSPDARGEPLDPARRERECETAVRPVAQALGVLPRKAPHGGDHASDAQAHFRRAADARWRHGIVLAEKACEDRTVGTKPRARAHQPLLLDRLEHMGQATAA